MGTAGDGLRTLWGPPLLLKNSDLGSLQCFSEAFEHLEETESSFEENSETNLLIKSRSDFSAPGLSTVVKEGS